MLIYIPIHYGSGTSKHAINTMKILYSCPLNPVKLAAPGQHVASVARELAKAGHDVTLIHQGEDLPGLDAVRQLPMKATRRRWFGRLTTDVKYAITLSGLLKREQFDSVYHRTEKWTVAPLLVFKFYKVPTVIEFNADVRAELSSTKSHWLIQFLYPISEYFQTRLSNHIIVVSEGISKNLIANFKNISQKIFVIENGADTGIYFPRDRLESCKATGLDPTKRYIVFSGRFQKWQGLETLIESAVEVTKVYPDVRFLLIGDGPMRETAELQITEFGLTSKFVLKGWQTPEKLSLYLAASDICVAPYSPLAALNPAELKHGSSSVLMKCSPLKIFTYMAMGKPVVASGFRDGGHRLKEWNTGISFEPGNSDQLSQALLTLLNDQSLSEKLGQNAVARVRQHHTWTIVAEKIDRLCFAGK